MSEDGASMTTVCRIMCSCFRHDLLYQSLFFLVSQILNNVWEKALKFVLIRALQTLAQDFFSSVAYFVIKSFLNFSSVLKRLNHSTSMSLPLLPQL